MFCVLLCLLCALVVNGDTRSEYLQRREALVQAEVDESLAGNVVLNANEVKANNILTAMQMKEVIFLGDNFPPALNFFHGKGWIDNSSIVFPLIKQMPKGSALHQHLDSTGSFPHLIYNLSYKYPCYMYEGTGNSVYPFGTIDCFGPSFLPKGPWTPLSVLRSKNPNFDAELMINITLTTRDYGDYYQLWEKFDDIFGTLSLLSCKEVREDYLTHLFYELKADGIQHAEFRTPPVFMHDLQNNSYSFVDFIEMFHDIANAANFSAKIIYAAFRHDPEASILQDMLDTIQLVKSYPDIVIGFDLDGPEDEGYPLYYFLDDFLEAINVSQGTLRFYFHAGETVFANNTNLYDALLLNTTRIGHGFQLALHPILMDEVKARGIGIEICPISNQVLEYSADLRTHPARGYFNRGMPISISSDDPAIYGYEGISYDFYEVFMGWNLDIRGLKQLAINSLQYSTWLNEEQETRVFNQWESAWNAWINTIIS